MRSLVSFNNISTYAVVMYMYLHRLNFIKIVFYCTFNMVYLCISDIYLFEALLYNILACAHCPNIPYHKCSQIEF